MHAAEYNILTDPFHNYEVIETALEPMEIQDYKERNLCQKLKLKRSPKKS